MRHFWKCHRKLFFHYCRHSLISWSNSKQNRQAIFEKIIYFAVESVFTFMKQINENSDIFFDISFQFFRFCTLDIFENFEINDDDYLLNKICVFEFFAQYFTDFLSNKIFFAENCSNILIDFKNTITMQAFDFIFFRNEMRDT